MKLIVHVGLPKTGTTSFQNFLRENRPYLIKKGVAPLVPPEIRQEQIARYTSANISEENRRMLLKSLKRLIAVRKDQNIHTILLSEENFLTCILPRKDYDYSTYPNYELAFGLLHELLTELHT